MGGNPAVFIKMRFDDELIQLLLQLKWWDWPIDKIVNNIDFLCSRPDYCSLNERFKSELNKASKDAELTDESLEPK